MILEENINHLRHLKRDYSKIYHILILLKEIDHYIIYRIIIQKDIF